jgi:hypothetical protein
MDHVILADSLILAVSKISNKGHYVSIDSRPMACARGTLKQVVTLHKSYLISASATEAIHSPFLCLNVRCPADSYDPNIEPAKDEVLFHDETTFLTIIEEYYKSFYGELKSKSKDGQKGVEAGVQSERNGSDLLLAMTPASLIKAQESRHGSHSEWEPVMEVDTGSEEVTADNYCSPPNGFLEDHLGKGPRKRQKWHHNMYGYDGDDEGMFVPESETPASTSEDAFDPPNLLSDSSISNPWTIAKLNAPARRAQRINHQHFGSGNDSSKQPKTPRRIPCQRIERMEPINMQMPLTPTPLEHSSPLTFNSISSQAFRPCGRHDNIVKGDVRGKRAKPLAGVPNKWTNSSHMSMTETAGSGDEDDEQASFPSKRSQYLKGDFVSASMLPHSNLRSPPATQARGGSATKSSPNFAFTPFKSHFRHGGSSTIELSPPRPAMLRTSRLKTVRDAIAESAPLSFDSENDDSISESSPVRPSEQSSLSNVKEVQRIDKQKREHGGNTQDAFRRQRLGQQEPGALSRSLEPNSQVSDYDNVTAKTLPSPKHFKLSEDDPRGYFMKHEHVGAFAFNYQQHSRRSLTVNLPLETIPLNLNVQDLVQVIETSVSSLRTEMETYDVGNYSRPINTTSFMQMADESLVALGDRLTAWMRRLVEDRTGEVSNATFDLGASVEARKSQGTTALFSSYKEQDIRL